ncbi:class I SAM-dependent methyltransferase [Parasediminibacterium paludis]|uniref:Class I SAM-dependent methyltransferase n=1 Tax=Parasediminibacterium paludis TaxID=908966 RepID=A0ABV8PWT0_9BACT
METITNKPKQSEEPKLAFAGKIPDVYESVLGNFIFEPFAKDLAARIVHRKGGVRVLELAAGTGRLTHYLTELLSNDSTIIATDLSIEMIEVGKQQVQSDNLRWQQVDIADIPFADNSFDLIVCQFGIMFLQDKVRGFSEIKRVLKPQGQFLFNVWGALEENRIWQITNQVLMQFTGEFPPLQHKVGPFSCSYIPFVQQQLQDAGFLNSTIEIVKQSNSIQSAAIAAKGFIHGLPTKTIILKSHPNKLIDIEKSLVYEFAAQLGDYPLTTSFTALIFNLFK